MHAQRLLSDVAEASRDAQSLAEETGHVISNVCLEVFGERNYNLKVESLEDARLGIEVRSVQCRDNQLRATIYVPEGKLERFVKKIERYERENTTPRTEGGQSRPKNEDLVAGISGIRFPVLRSFWMDDDGLFPISEDESIWWEAWVNVASSEDADDAFAAFVAATQGSELQLSPHAVRFPERLVFLALGTPRQWTRMFVPLLDRLAELRKAKEVPTEFLRLAPQEQRALVESIAPRLTAPSADAPAVCLLDHGIHGSHPLLRPFLQDEDAQAFTEEWTAVDRAEAHGTEMAGLVVFGEHLPDILSNQGIPAIPYRLESVRMLRAGRPHPEETWGYVTQASLAMAEVRAPRRRRVACLPVSACDEGRDCGRPTSWSGAVDQHAAGQLDNHRRLYIVSAGNVRDLVSDNEYTYPVSNFDASGIEDPGQSWNALTIGAVTGRVHIRSDDFSGYQPVARLGGLCPSSRTSHAWGDNTWPLKPDIVMEGGNYAHSPDGQIDGCDDLALLTTTLDNTGRLLTWTGDTSAATAQAARLAAILMADYPELWPETIRGLLIHSAAWTDEMQRQVPGDGREDLQKRLRCFGYGIPELERARHTVENSVSLVHQGHMQPFKLVGTEAKTNHFVLHSLPWPRAALAAIHDQDVTVRVTLSYFIEPSPAGRGWGKKFRYASHGLRFALRGPIETEPAFLRRISSQEWEEESRRPTTSDPITWTIGSRLRTRGSVHCDWWTASGAEVADCGQIAVFPVTGWWRERKHLRCVEKRARYALIVTISTPATEVDLYTPIAQLVGLTTEIAT